MAGPQWVLSWEGGASRVESGKCDKRALPPLPVAWRICLATSCTLQCWPVPPELVRLGDPESDLWEMDGAIIIPSLEQGSNASLEGWFSLVISHPFIQ
jgi:hypothetical protein